MRQAIGGTATGDAQGETSLRGLNPLETEVSLSGAFLTLLQFPLICLLKVRSQKNASLLEELQGCPSVLTSFPAGKALLLDEAGRQRAIVDLLRAVA